jgi:hypothetical protein
MFLILGDRLGDSPKSFRWSARLTLKNADKPKKEMSTLYSSSSFLRYII